MPLLNLRRYDLRNTLRHAFRNWKLNSALDESKRETRMYLQAVLERNRQFRALQQRADQFANEIVAKNNEIAELQQQVSQLEWAAVYSQQQMAQFEEQRSQLEKVALLDPLTGLHNRRGAADALQRMLGSYRRREHHQELPRHNLCVIMMDLNDFKGVNDTHGHAMGDRVLIRVADHLRTAFRSDDIVCRSGGDEFLAYLIGSTGEGAVERAQTLVDLMRDDSELHIGEYRVRMSIGVAVGSFHSSDGGAEISDPLVTMADQAMYQSKRLKGFAEETPIMLAKETVLSPTVFSGLTD